jgi:hypothetical protein
VAYELLRNWKNRKKQQMRKYVGGNGTLFSTKFGES